MSGVFLDWRFDQKNNSFKIHESLCVDEILSIENIAGGNHTLNRYILNPQNIVNVTLLRPDGSEVEMEEHKFGLIFAKIGVYRKGLWIVEPGFIHPKYKGVISIHICNLSKAPILINKGDPLVEIVTFMSHSPGNVGHKGSPNRTQYVNDRCSEALMFPKTFIDVDENVKRIKDEVGVKPFYNMLSLMLVIFTLIVGLSGWLNWDIGKEVRDAVVNQKELEDIDIKNEMNERINQEKYQMEERIKKLEDEIGSLKKGKG